MKLTWIDEVLDACKMSETPRSFIFWTTLFCVGAATKRRISLQLGNLFKLYPNLYILLIAESGLGKQFPVNLSKGLLSATGKVRIISGGQNSIQGVLRQLGKAVTLPSGTMIRNGEAAFISGEFNNFFVPDPLAFPTAMELYDTDAHDNYEKMLRDEKFLAKNVFINWLAVSNLELFNNRMADHELKGGFLARFLSIKEDEVEQLNSLTKTLAPINYPELAKRLIRITELEGQFDYGPGAAQHYDNWYYKFYGDKNRFKDKAYFSNRLRGHILKVAMCLSLTYKDELLLSVEDIETAIQLCKPLLETVRELTEEMGQSRYKGLNAIITKALLNAKNYRIQRSKLIAMNRGEWTLKDFNDAVALLESSDIVETVSLNGNVYVRFTSNALKKIAVGKKELEKEKGSA